jgi:hypothetical protein
MKTFQQFLNEIKTIKYPMAKAHKVYMKGKVQNVPVGKAVPFNPGSGAGDGGGNGNGD